MSTKKKVIVTTAPRNTQSAPRAKMPTSIAPKNTVLIFDKSNYFLMLVGLALIGLGLVLMSGGAMPDPNTWDEGIIYSHRRTLLAPLTILLGLIVEIVAIFKNPKSESVTVEETL